MATKEAHSKANIEYNRRQDNIMVRPSKEMGAKIREAAAAESMSVQGYILQTLYARTGATGGGVVKNLKAIPSSEEQQSCLISPDRKKILQDILNDIVLNSSSENRNGLEKELLQIVREAIKENAEQQYRTISESLL